MKLSEQPGGEGGGLKQRLIQAVEVESERPATLDPLLETGGIEEVPPQLRCTVIGPQVHEQGGPVVGSGTAGSVNPSYLMRLPGPGLTEQCQATRARKRFQARELK